MIKMPIASHTVYETHLTAASHVKRETKITVRAMTVMKPGLPLRARKYIETHDVIASHVSDETYRSIAKPNLKRKERTMQTNETMIRSLKFYLKTYDGVKKLLQAAKQRIKSMNPDTLEKFQEEIQWMESQKGKLKREIVTELKHWDIWTEWMHDINGIGPFIAGNLVMLYYYRFVALCKKCGADLEDFTCTSCGAKAKGDGLLDFRIEEKDFKQVSSWWHYMGEHNDPETGRMARRKKDVKSDWSNLGRNISWQIGESFNKCNGDHKYKAFYNRFKEKEKRHSDAIRRTRKLFLSHFWHVARELEGKSTEGPYAEVILKHTGIIPPYYWETLTEEKAA